MAEGVESQDVFEILRELGFDVAQGYAIGKPMPRAEFEHWYHAWQRGGHALNPARPAGPALPAPVRTP